MNTSQFMDKQIMDLTNSHNNNDFIDLMNPKEDHIGGCKKEEIVPSYDFQPIRPIVASQPSNLDPSNVGVTRVWNSADSKTNVAGVGVRNYGSLDSIEPAKVILEKDRNVFDAALVSEIDQTMKKHADNLLHALEGVSARLSQLESRTRHLENSVDDLRVSVGNNHGSTDGKLRQLENILREVQSGVQVVRDKQEIVEAHLQLVNLQVSKGEQQSETQNTLHVDSVQQAASAPHQSHQQLPPVAIMQPPSGLPPPNAPPPPTSQQNLPPPVQLQNQYPQNQIPAVPQRESYFPPPGQAQEATNQQFQLPPPQLPPPPTPQQQYQPPPHPQYSQPPPPTQQHPSLSAVSPPQPQTSLGHHPEETPYMPSQNYPPSVRQPPSHPPSGVPPSQQFYGTPSHMFEPPSSRQGSGFSTAYGPSSAPSDPYPYGGSPSQYGSGSTIKPPQLSHPAMAPSGGSNYPQLPTARILPQALPTASGVGSGSGSAGTGNRVPIDDVVDKVTNMGFSRDQVRATVRKLTESGQSVDLNVVLDKLMNDGEGGQPPRGWFGR
ncbi:hypothetical protein F0562_004604 [Nyssa sinensis]|uniref:DUF1421 domain-containing protein n=1 Tax=Nyssa sinensis TaxID=561372 RepID=A0A5J5BYG2_9ASTE|nr:hypothetical protein F0562_004604 [Nyssa sinensis]